MSAQSNKLQPPAGRRALFAFTRRHDPMRRLPFPYEAVIAEPARWPAGEDWQRRVWLARPLRRLAMAIDCLARRFSGPLLRLATDIEGQPTVWWCAMEGWRERRGMRDGRWCSSWVYEGPITPAIREMFAAHPERFADSSPALLYQLRVGQ